MIFLIQELSHFLSTPNKSKQFGQPQAFGRFPASAQSVNHNGNDLEGSSADTLRPFQVLYYQLMLMVLNKQVCAVARTTAIYSRHFNSLWQILYTSNSCYFGIVVFFFFIPFALSKSMIYCKHAFDISIKQLSLKTYLLKKRSSTRVSITECILDKDFFIKFVHFDKFIIEEKMDTFYHKLISRLKTRSSNFNN